MMRQYELVERVKAYDPQADEGLLNRAYVYAMKMHGQQTRASGDPYISHPLEVAAILADLKLDDATIVSALLHDTIEDTHATRADIDDLFGEEIGALVEGLTKIAQLDLVTKKAEQAENFRKLLLAITSDVRVLLVKLADRLHNMRTLEYVRPEKRKRIAEETMDIYAPLAGRMGMQWLRDELEELAFQTLNPKAYQIVVLRLEKLRKENRGLIDEIKEAIREKLKEHDIDAEVHGREKKPYSIWNKMERKQISLEQLSDIYAFRIIVGKPDECYQVVGAIHTSWRMVPGRFKDYISTPKQNDYQSIHTTIVGPRHRRVELQVRTHRMHQLAEYGIAAHSLYKDKGDRSSNGSQRLKHAALTQESSAYRWLRRLVDTLLEGDNPEEFLEHTKLELFHDQVFCFTPKGLLIALASGATPIDFAYAVHTDIGNSCTGCKINGRSMPLMTELNNGDEVQIITSKSKMPPAAWERVVVTGKARSAIRRATREAVREQYSRLGREILGRAFKRIGKTYRRATIERALPRLSQKTSEDVLAAVGRGELPSADLLQAAYPKLPRLEPPKRTGPKRLEEGWFGLTKAIGLKFRLPGGAAKNSISTSDGIPIRGLRGELPVKFNERGGALPGDRIVGIMTSGEGIEIYPIHSPTLKEFDDQPERWIDVRWDIDIDRMERFPSRIIVSAINEPGSLAQIAQLIGETGGNIDSIKMQQVSDDYTDMVIDLGVWDLAHLNDILAGLRGKSVVSAVRRSYD